MTSFRWWLFKRLSAIGWRICPEPHRSRLQSVMPTWEHARTMWEIVERERQRDGVPSPAPLRSRRAG